MFDLISIGNISIDLYFKGKTLTLRDERFQLALEGKYFAEEFYISLGGGGANVAIGVAKFGLKTALVGQIDQEFFRNKILDILNLYHISTDYLEFIKNYINISCILLSEQGKRSIIHYTSPVQELNVIKSKIKLISQSKIVFLGNIPSINVSSKIEIVKKLKKNGAKIIINLGVSDCRKPKNELIELLQVADILILNSHEFADLVKAPHKDIHFHEDVVGWYIPSLQKKIVIVTVGEKGSYCYFNNKVHYQEALKIKKIIDTTGTGDAFTSGFIADLILKNNLYSAIEAGTKYAAKNLQKIGAN